MKLCQASTFGLLPQLTLDWLAVVLMSFLPVMNAATVKSGLSCIENVLIAAGKSNWLALAPFFNLLLHYCFDAYPKVPHHLHIVPILFCRYSLNCSLQQTFVPANFLVQINTLQTTCKFWVPLGLDLMLWYSYVFCTFLSEALHCNLKLARSGSGMQVR